MNNRSLWHFLCPNKENRSRSCHSTDEGTNTDALSQRVQARTNWFFKAPSTIWPPWCLGLTQRIKIVQSRDTMTAYDFGSWEAHAQVCEQGICSKPVEFSGIIPPQTSYKFGELSVLSVSLNLNQSASASGSIISFFFTTTWLYFDQYMISFLLWLRFNTVRRSLPDEAWTA